MIALNNTGDTVVMLIVAAVVGALAGLGAFVLQTRGSAAGADETLDWRASMLIGAIASVGVLYFFSPVTSTTMTLANGATKTTSEYDLVKVVSLGVIVGSGGRAFLTALQGRATALLSQQTSANLASAAGKAIGDAQTKAQNDAETIKGLIDQHASSLATAAAAPGAPEAVTNAAAAFEALRGEVEQVTDQAQAHLQEAQGRIEAAAGPELAPTVAAETEVPAARTTPVREDPPTISS